MGSANNNGGRQNPPGLNAKMSSLKKKRRSSAKTSKKNKRLSLYYRLTEASGSLRSGMDMYFISHYFFFRKAASKIGVSVEDAMIVVLVSEMFSISAFDLSEICGCSINKARGICNRLTALGYMDKVKVSKSMSVGKNATHIFYPTSKARSLHTQWVLSALKPVEVSLSGK